MKYADTMKETVEKSQEKAIAQTKEYISQLIESENHMIDKILDNNRTMLNETTNQLLQGLQNIFGVGTSTRTINNSYQMILSIVPFKEVPYLYSNEVQHYQPSLNLPKVLINLKRPVSSNEENQRVKIQKLNSCSNINRKEHINDQQKDTITNTNNETKL